MKEKHISTMTQAIDIRALMGTGGPVDTVRISAQTQHPHAIRAQDARRAWVMQNEGKDINGDPLTEVLHPEDRMAMIAMCFPVLWNKPWCNPFNAQQLDAWAAENTKTLSHGTLGAMQFLLWLWNSHKDWQSGTFDLRSAWAHWDNDQRLAWKLWASNPYFP